MVPLVPCEVLHEHALVLACEQMWVVPRHPKHRGSNPPNHHVEKSVAAGAVNPRCRMLLETTPLPIVALLSLVDDASRVVVVVVFWKVERRRLAQTIVPSSNVVVAAAALENADDSDWISLACENGSAADLDCGSHVYAGQGAILVRDLVVPKRLPRAILLRTRVATDAMTWEPGLAGRCCCDWMDSIHLVV